MRKYLAFILALICAVGTVGCSAVFKDTVPPNDNPIDVHTNGDQSGGTPVEEAFDIAVSYAGWTKESEIYLGALNQSTMVDSSVQHLPIYKFSTLEELEQFKLSFGEVLRMDYGFDEIPSFNDTTAKYDETFFGENTLMLVYVDANSGTYRFGVSSVFHEGNTFCIYIKQLNVPETDVTADLAGWFITVVVPDSMVENCVEFDAVLNRSENESFTHDLVN